MEKKNKHLFSLLKSWQKTGYFFDVFFRQGSKQIEAIQSRFLQNKITGILQRKRKVPQRGFSQRESPVKKDDFFGLFWGLSSKVKRYISSNQSINGLILRPIYRLSFLTQKKRSIFQGFILADRYLAKSITDRSDCQGTTSIALWTERKRHGHYK